MDLPDLGFIISIFHVLDGLLWESLIYSYVDLKSLLRLMS